MQFLVTLPVLAQPWCREVPIRAYLARDLAEIITKVFGRRPTPEPVAIIDFVNDQPRLKHERMRNHRDMERVSVLLDVQLLLDLASRVREESPLGPNGGAELICFKDIVR